MSKDQVIDAENQADDAYEDEWAELEDEEQQQPSDNEVDESDSESEEESPPDEESDDSAEKGETPADDELGFSFDTPADEQDDNKAPEWVREVRKQNRELKKKVRELEANKPQSTAPELRPMPTWEEHNWNEASFSEDMNQWEIEKEQHDNELISSQQQVRQIYENYHQDAKRIKERRQDFDEKQKLVTDVLSVEQQNLILTEVVEPAKLTYMLGGSPEKLNEIADLSPTQFLKQIGILEYQMTQSASKKGNPNKPKPKKHVVRGGAGGGDAKLTKLEAEAEKTGDRSKLIAYKREQKRKQ